MIKTNLKQEEDVAELTGETYAIYNEMEPIEIKGNIALITYGLIAGLWHEFCIALYLVS